MAFGFGFNKTKVLNAAERYVQQGKLQSAIAEYEKIAKQDPNDLTVLNTIGDLYARVGNADSAATYFRKVGDAYAADGFTVKSIAMYKKLTKLSPTATDCVLKLAELYTQQGLYNDARSQYVQVADQYMKAGELEQATRIFKKMLELDPENTAMQAKLADLYVRLGKKPEARDIFFRAADSLYGRGALDGADAALVRVLNLEPNNSRALLLRGQIALDSGNGAGAIEYLEKVPQIDSLPDALAALLRAYISVSKLDEAGPIAHKLLTVHNQLSGLHAYADALIAGGNYEQALHLYDENADRLLAADPAALGEPLRVIIGRLKENPAALELLRSLYQKAGDTTQIGEVTELLAHALVQQGNLERARDLYQHLAELEPENPLHAQNYRQIVSRLGQDVVARPLSEEESSQPFMAEELEFTAPPLVQEYPPEIGEAIRAAITESELFDSYNLPAKAIAPLEAALPKAPEDAHLNQRLASLYARARRFPDAARCCAVLQRLYDAAGFTEQAGQYGGIAAKYAQTAGVPSATPALPLESPAVSPSVAGGEFAVTAAADPECAAESFAPAFQSECAAESFAPAFQVEAAPAVQEIPPPAAAHEIDLSDEWESALVIEPPAPAAPPPADDTSTTAEIVMQPEPPPPGAVADLLDEARFYLAQSMWDEAAQALARCEATAPQVPELADLKQQFAAATAARPAPEIEVVEEPAAEEAETAATSTVSTLVFDAAALGLPKDAAAARPAETVVAPPVLAKPVPAISAAAAAAAVPAPPSAGVLGQFTAELDQSLGTDFSLAPAPPAVTPPPLPVPRTNPAPVQAAPAAAAAAPAPEPVAADPQTSSALFDMFAEFKEGLEDSAEQPEDAETHYNLGVAFKEMGLLDEAIGELQKVCHAIDHGEPFAQVMQAYTWLAQCLVEKGVPEAAIRWYDKALKLPGGDDESSTALHYDLACAYLAAGNRQAALAHFMEVYGTNIDYRDVAERIKALKS